MRTLLLTAFLLLTFAGLLLVSLSALGMLGPAVARPTPCLTDIECHAADHTAGITVHGYGAGHPGDFPGHSH